MFNLFSDLFRKKKKPIDPFILDSSKYSELSLEEKARHYLEELSNYVYHPDRFGALVNGSLPSGHINFSDTDRCSLGHYKSSPSAKPTIHDSMVQTATQNFQLQLSKLQNKYFQIATVMLLSTTALALSAVSGFCLLLAIAGATTFGYMLKDSESVRNDYQAALKNIAAVYIWVFNDPKAGIKKDGKPLEGTLSYKAAAHQALYQERPPTLKASASTEATASPLDAYQSLLGQLNESIKTLHLTFAPYVSKARLRHFIYTKDRQLERLIIDGMESEQTKALEEGTTSKLQLSLSYVLFGYDQGNEASKIVSGLWGWAVQTATQAAGSLHQTYQQWSAPSSLF